MIETMQERKPLSRWRVKKALYEFVRELKKSEGDNLIEVTLFGSVARDEDHEGSDVDVFVLLKEDEDGHARRRVVGVAYKVNATRFSSGVYLAPVVMTKKMYDDNPRTALLIYIAREGIVLYDANA